MIKLPIHNDTTFIDNYVKKWSAKIDGKYNTLSTIDQNTFDDFYNGVSGRDEFIRDLLSNNLDEVINNYPSVREYFEIAFFYSLDIILICKGKRRNEMREIREQYCDRFWVNATGVNKGSWTRSNIIRRQDNFKKFQSHVRAESKKKYGFLDKVFNYKEVTSDDKSQIVSSLGIKVCPYCNRSYISCFEDKLEKNKRRTSADLDHFYSKSDFPLFALSLYNFVPSCKVCNQIFKSDRNLDLLYPYSESYDGFAKFKLRMKSNVPISAAKVYGWQKGNKLCINLSADPNKGKAEREISLFRIEELYQCHNDFAEQLVYKKNVLGKRAEREIWEFITKNKMYAWSKMSREEFSIFFYGVNRYMREEEKRNTPLGKLIIDILGM